MVVLFKKCLQGLLMAWGIVKDAECTVRIQKHLNIAVIPQKPHEGQEGRQSTKLVGQMRKDKANIHLFLIFES